MDVPRQIPRFAVFDQIDSLPALSPPWQILHRLPGGIRIVRHSPHRSDVSGTNPRDSRKAYSSGERLKNGSRKRRRIRTASYRGSTALGGEPAASRRWPLPAGRSSAHATNTCELLRQGCLSEAIEAYYSSPVAGEGKGYMLSKTGKAVVLQADPDRTVLQTNDLGEEAYATPAIGRDWLDVRMATRPYCFSD